MTPFGRIVSFDQVEREVAAQLSTWMPTYVAELERQRGLAPGYFEGDLEYVAASDFGRFSEDRLPCVVIVCPGLTDRPVRDGDGVYRCTFAVLVGIFASALDRDTSDEAAKAYGACIRTIMVQRPRVGELDAGGVKWVGERYDDVDADDTRTLAGGAVSFTIEVDDVASTFAGPMTPLEGPAATPATDPYTPLPDDPTATTWTLDVHHTDEEPTP